jgi:DNA (cytosine-5)-methyltransferase 1
MPTFYEFFAGGGMARMGLGPDWTCEFANDISPMKAQSYVSNFDKASRHFVRADINYLEAKTIPGNPDLLWGSFPCQDLSLAGNGMGLGGARSGLIWKLLNLAKDLKRQGRGPKLIVLENVTGLLNSRDGMDFYDILANLRNDGFVFGTLMMDAVKFLPHSRPRIFLVAVASSQVNINLKLTNGRMSQNYPWTSPRLDTLWRNAPAPLRDSWVWWSLPAPKPRRSTIADILEPNVDSWDTEEYTERLLRLMAPLHLDKVRKASSLGTKMVGTLYRRTRIVDGIRSQRVEVRFDGVSGCLRTPSGGSSKQRLLFVHGERIRSRLLTTRETARLMGIPDDYILPDSYNDAYQIAGDGVAVPVVHWLSEHLLMPLLATEQYREVAQTELLYA